MNYLHLLSQNLIELYEELRSESNDLGLVDDSIDARAVSKRFITSFCKYIEGLGKSLFGPAKAETTMPPGGDLFSLDLSELLNQDAPDRNAASEGDPKENDALDVRVNSRITCTY